jgi:hypothetical protein
MKTFGSFFGGLKHDGGGLEGPPLLIIHIAKTAGTSLRRMLQAELGMPAIYPSDRDLVKLPHGWYRSGRDILENHHTLPPHRVLIGHFAAELADRLPIPYSTAAFVRDPLQRSLSCLAHFERHYGRPPTELLRDTDFIGTQILDYQTKVLGGRGITDLHEHCEIDDATLSRAIARIGRLDFVGITERSPESFELFDRRFGTHIAQHQVRENVLRPEGRELSELLPRIEELVRRDRVLYEAAVARLEIDLAAAPARGHT